MADDEGDDQGRAAAAGEDAAVGVVELMDPRFGLLVGIFAAIGLWPMLWRHESPRTWAVTLAVLLVGSALVAPGILAPAYRVWMKLAEVLAWINTRILLGVVFYLVVKPIGLIMRLLRRNPAGGIFGLIGLGLILAALVLLIAGCATQSQDGRGGILESPVGLDTTDPLHTEYMEHVRQRIHEKWGYPCVLVARTCEYKNTSLEADFGILKDGRVQFVEIVRNADFPIYDEYAVAAIKLASPFRPVPPAIMAAMRPGSSGIPIRARFVYETQRHGGQRSP